jgi:hypothetical protein
VLDKSISADGNTKTDVTVNYKGRGGEQGTEVREGGIRSAILGHPESGHPEGPESSVRCAKRMLVSMRVIVSRGIKPLTVTTRTGVRAGNNWVRRGAEYNLRFKGSQLKLSHADSVVGNAWQLPNRFMLAAARSCCIPTRQKFGQVCKDQKRRTICTTNFIFELLLQNADRGQ